MAREVGHRERPKSYPMKPSAPADQAGSSSTRGRPAAVSVLVVDDHAGYRSVAAAVVAAAPGFTLTGSAASSTEVFDVLAGLTASPDLVLMDVNLGDESGIDVSERLVAAHPGTKVVLVSTLRPDELPPGTDACGASGYLPKMQLSPTTLARVWAGAYDWAP